MASIHGIDIRDNVLFYHRTFIRKGIVDVTSQYRNYSCYEELKNAEKISKDNKSFHFPLMVDGYDNNQYTSNFQPDSLGRTSLGAEGVSYWSDQKTGWFASRKEPGYPKGASAAQIVKVFDMHRNNMFKKFYQFNEKARWINPTGPNDGSGGQVAVFGIPHYVVQSATAAVGQNGAAPSGYSTVSGLSRTTHPELKNWTATATDMSLTNGQQKLSDMIDLMQWQCLPELPGEQKATHSYVIESHRTPYAMWQRQQYAFTGDSDIHADPAKLLGNNTVGNGLFFRTIPWRWVDALTQSTTRDGTSNPAYDDAQPVYLLDKSTWIVYAAEGIFMDESEPIRAAEDHNRFDMHMDSMYQRVCINPGANGVVTFA
jgi:hypothetical protein